MRFGRWRALARAPYAERLRANDFKPVPAARYTYWWCRCTCGSRVPVRASTLTDGSSRGCITCHNRSHHQGIPSKNRKDMTGLVFGQWTVEGFSHTVNGRTAYWMCVCSCGTRKPVNGNSLRMGDTTKCPSCAVRGRRRR